MLSSQQSAAFRRRLLHWYSKHGRDLPWRRTRDPYAILVSEVMLQQTQVSAVLPYYEAWLRRFPTVATLAAASESEVLHAWQGLGYYSRARNLHLAAKLLVERHGGALPSTPELLRTLPGMGRYTANAIATFAFDQSLPIVEANITRVLARLFNIRAPVDSTSGRERLWQHAAKLVPARNAGRFNSALMDLGALICVNRMPKCQSCPVKTFCRAVKPELLPVKKARPEMVQLVESHAFVRQRDHVLLEHCSKRWRGMWMLPRLLSGEMKTKSAIHTSVFPFTHHRITLRVFPNPPDNSGRVRHRWVSIDDLSSIPIPSPHRRAIHQLLQTTR